MKIYIEKLNEVYLRFYCDDMGVESDIVNFFKFKVPGAQFTPLYKAHLWDGFIRLADPIRKTLYCGLFHYMEKFAENNDHELELVNEVFTPDHTINKPLIEQYVEDLELCSRGNRIQIHDYQLDAVVIALANYRSVLLSPTGSGKSLIIYVICRYLIEQDLKALVVVPTTSLVEQFYSDFEDYSTVNQWDVKGNCQKIYSGFPKIISNPVTFSTWQSIHRQPKAWYDQFDIIVGDECHLFKAKSLTSIMEKMTDVKYRIGTTGSIDNKKMNRLVLEGIFGRLHTIATTKELQDKGTLSTLAITSIILNYPEEVRKQCKKMSYVDEIGFIITNERRNKFLCNLALRCTGNTLLLFNLVEKHGQVLYDMISEKAKDRKVYFIHGGVDVDDRENIRQILSMETDVIIVASFGTMSTGINIPSIENLIFAAPSKSIIRVLQSIGRGLRLNEGKTQCNLFDITDNLQWKTSKNHTLKHGAERFKLYMSEQFKTKLVEVNL